MSPNVLRIASPSRNDFELFECKSRSIFVRPVSAHSSKFFLHCSTSATNQSILSAVESTWKMECSFGEAFSESLTLASTVDSRQPCYHPFTQDGPSSHDFFSPGCSIRRSPQRPLTTA